MRCFVQLSEVKEIDVDDLRLSQGFGVIIARDLPYKTFVSGNKAVFGKEENVLVL